MPRMKKKRRNPNFQKKMEDEKPKESECDVKRPSGTNNPIFGLYYISSNGFNSYWPVQRLNDGYLKSHSEGCCEYSHIKPNHYFCGTLSSFVLLCVIFTFH